MRLSRDKINHLSNLILKHLQKDDDIELLKEDNDIRLNIFHTFMNEMEMDDKIDVVVRRRISSYSRQIGEGTREWEVMYQKLYEEELNKLGRA